MKTITLSGTLLLLLTLVFPFQSCTKTGPTDLTQSCIIPKPLSVSADGEAFRLTKRTNIVAPDGDTALVRVGEYLAGLLKPATGYPFPVEKAVHKGSIVLVVSENDAEYGTEGYELDITRKQVTITAGTPAGVFHGIQTLRQILPPEIEESSVQPGPWILPTGIVTDKPEYGYRGAMLDVSRHFFHVDEVKRFIDLIALYKLNFLHLHLSDDQGWRIEIKSWPKLTEIGGKTEVGGGEGGFYTQEQYSDLVQYAMNRFITIVPEIDMPGHTNAALASYAELNCDGKARDLYTGTNVGFSTLCTGKEIVYKFIDDVVGELASLTPGPYIHIGGDESHATPMEDYIPFENRVQQIVRKHGKKVIGWDEIANATLAPNTTVHYWAEKENALKGVKQGAKVLMSPANRTYLDMQYDSTTALGLHWAGYIEVDTAYRWDPAHLVEGIGRDDIIGIEAPLWSETITDIKDIEYMVFPRIIALAEVGWTPAKLRSWDDFRSRLACQGTRLTVMDVNFYRSPRINWSTGKEDTGTGK
ncbi:MAG: family 20 glycosylhydrolase [Chlorobi bacterium]|nr:family 20 glycosylhydrolase [Chlorobiota bacterium]